MTLKRLTIEYLDIKIFYSEDMIVIVLFTAGTIPQAFYCLVAELGTGVISMYRTPQSASDKENKMSKALG